MLHNTTCLITGANRGIGKSLVAAYLARPHHTVIATVRDPAHPTAQSLHDLPLATAASDGTGANNTNPTSRLIILQMDSASSASIATAFSSLTSDHGIQTLDLVIANAGIGFATARSLAEENRSELQRFVDVNAYGPFEVFGAALPLMREAAAAKKAGNAAEGQGNGEGSRPSKSCFVLISSNLGSFGLMGGAAGYGLYGASKVMANFLVKWLALENKEEVVAFAVHPGPVKTDMGKNAIEQLEKMGYDLNLKWMEVEESAGKLQELIEDAESKDFNGRFLQYDGTELPW